MNFRCSELQGAIHQPNKLLELDNCWIIPACKDSPVLTMPDCKLVFVYEDGVRKENGALEEYLFVHCYQFLFCRHSFMYWSYSLRQANHSGSLVLSGTDINNIEKQIRNKYGQQHAALSIDFTNIESPFKTFLPTPVNFQVFYGKFTELYKKDEGFKEIITLFCETINGLKPLYNNVLQQIAQLQTIFETIIDKPKGLKEKWAIFLKKRLKDYGITNQDDISLIIKINKTLNDVARIKYVHHSDYYNPRDPHNMIADLQATEGNSSYSSDTHAILNKQPESWKAIDWENLYSIYMVLVRNLIYYKYFTRVSTSAYLQ